MKKSIFLFFAAILCAMTANAVDYYYRGQRVNNWGAGQKLEVSTDAYYSYIHFAAGAEHEFKICEAADDWSKAAYGKTYNSVGFNGTDVTELGDNWGGDNCKIWSSNAHYVLVYHPNTAINNTNKPIICASTTLPYDGDCHLMGVEGDWDNGIKMELNSSDKNVFFLLDQPINGPIKFKLNNTWTDQVENYDKNGVDWEGGNIVLPAGNYDFYFKKDIMKVYIARNTVVTTTANPAEGGTLTGAGVYNNDDDVTLTATPNTGYNFVNWTKGGTQVSTDATYAFKAAGDVEYVANFAPATATITLVDAKDLGATLTLSADEYAVGDEITASAAIYDDGFAFAYWKEGENIVSYSADYTFTVEGDRTLEAYFGNNMPVEMADLVVDGDAMTITSSNTTDGVTVSLKLDEYDSDMELWSVDAANSTISLDPLGSGTPITLDVLYSEVWLDMDAFSMAMAKVVATYNDELFVFNLDMTAATETLEVGVATELSLEFGALVMRGTWYDENEVEYPFEAQVGGFDYTKAEQECMTTVSLGNFDDDTNWLGMAQGLMTVTVADGTVELTGTVTTNYPINTLNVVAQGNIQILPMDIDVTVEEMDMGEAVYLKLNGTDYESGIDVELYLNDYTGADKTYELNEASSIAGGAAQAMGSLTKAGNTYTGVAYASAMGALYVLELNLTEFVPEYENIVVTGLSGAAEARSLGWGNEYYLALSLEGTWSDGVVTYPVSVELADYDPAVTSGTTYVSLSIGGWEDDQEWLGSIDGGEMNFSISGKTITLTGKLDNAYNWPAPIYWDLTITGTILPNYTRDVTAGNFGTLCLPFGGTVEGAELFECVGQETGKVYIASVTELEAGVPYIFLATANQIAVYCDATVSDEAGSSNGLHGTFDDNTIVENGNYILKDNELRESDGNAKVNANRAYLVMSDVPAGAPQQMPGRKYIGMSTKGENATTGLDNITNGENTTIKVIENGQLIIIRNGEKFNAQGVRF